MRKFAALVLLCLASCITGSRNTEVNPQHLIQDALQRNVTIYNEGQMICSGFVLETNVVLTAGHCGEDVKRLVVNGETAKVIRRSLNPDLTELRAETGDFPALKMRNPHWWEKILSMGNKGLTKNVWSFGRVLFKFPHSTFTNTLAFPGYSGSCIYSMREELLGVHVQAMYVSNFSISVPGKEVQKFVQRKPGS